MALTCCFNAAVQAQLKRTEIDVQQMIQDRETKVEEIKHCVELNKVSLARQVRQRDAAATVEIPSRADWPAGRPVLSYRCLVQASTQREIEESVQVFAEVVRSIQRTQAELVVSIEEKQRRTERWADGFVAELEREIAELKIRKRDLENVARTDHIHFLKVRELSGFRALEQSLNFSRFSHFRN